MRPGLLDLKFRGLVNTLSFTQSVYTSVYTSVRLHVILYRGHKSVVQRRVRVLCQRLRLGLRSEHGGLD